MRSRFREMHQQMQDQMNQPANGNNVSNNTQVKKGQSRPASEDYIEFEEVN